MRIFRARDDQELADHWSRIEAGEYLEDPKDGFMWDAATARYNRHVMGEYAEDKASVKDWIKWILMIAMVTIFAVAMYQGGVW